MITQGTLASTISGFCAIAAFEQPPPTIMKGWTSWISFFTAPTPLLGRHSSSSLMYTILRPCTPPASFASSNTACTPLSCGISRFDSGPVIAPMPPILISSLVTPTSAAAAPAAHSASNAPAAKPCHP
jgi:hypothetical protein